MENVKKIIEGDNVRYVVVKEKLVSITLDEVERRINTLNAEIQELNTVKTGMIEDTIPEL